MDILKLVGYDLHTPTECEQCGGELTYTGLGEYKCIKCNIVMCDYYGKVRNYLEKHRGATMGETVAATGVPKNVVREFLIEEKIEIAPDSAVFLRCQKCGERIRSGALCLSCSSKRAAMAESMARQTTNNVQGFGKVSTGASGARRFEH